MLRLSLRHKCHMIEAVPYTASSSLSKITNSINHLFYKILLVPIANPTP